MGNQIFVIARGRFAELCRLPKGTDSVVAVLFKGTIQADDTMNNHTSLASVKASNTEADFTNYDRLVVTGLTPILNNTANTHDIDCVDLVWLSAGGPVSGNVTVTKCVFAYRPTAGAADSEIIPLSFHDVNSTTTGTDLVIQIPASGFVGAA